jgi:hypothetical protein
MSQYGSNELKYLVVKGWGELPPGWDFGQVIGVAVDSSDKIYVFNRGEHPLLHGHQ